MSHVDQLRHLRYDRRMSIGDLAGLSSMDASTVSDVLEGRYDALESTLEALAAGLNAKWVLVPTDLLPSIRKILNVTGCDPDYDAPSAVQLFVPQKTLRIFGFSEQASFPAGSSHIKA
jgi:transcriptional regulator with XRE-family HTH domain